MGQNSDKTVATYVWRDGNAKLRSKTKIVSGEIYDTTTCSGSLFGLDQPVLLEPARVFTDPFTGGDLVICSPFRADDGSIVETESWRSELSETGLTPVFCARTEFSINYRDDTVNGGCCDVKGPLKNLTEDIVDLLMKSNIEVTGCRTSGENRIVVSVVSHVSVVLDMVTAVRYIVERAVDDVHADVAEEKTEFRVSTKQTRMREDTIEALCEKLSAGIDNKISVRVPESVVVREESYVKLSSEDLPIDRVVVAVVNCLKD